MTTTELYKQGKLSEAITAALGDVKKSPSDSSRRMLLCELLCFAGDWKRADKQLETIAQQDPKTVVNVTLCRQLIRAETARQEFFTDGRLPEFLEEVSDVLRLHLEASIAIREGNFAEASTLLKQAEAKRPQVSGNCDGQAFADFRDLDDLTAPFFEVLTSTGKYFWIPIEKVVAIEFRKPNRVRDLIWRSAQMDVSGGPSGEVYIPVIYPSRQADDEDELLRMGRGTQWIEGEGSPARGVGQRVFMVGEDDRSIMELTSLSFDK